MAEGNSKGRIMMMCRVVLNMFFFSPEWAGAADELQVLPIAWKTEMTSQDYTEWYNFEFEYCNQVHHLHHLRHCLYRKTYIQFGSVPRHKPHCLLEPSVFNQRL